MVLSETIVVRVSGLVRVCAVPGNCPALSIYERITTTISALMTSDKHPSNAPRFRAMIVFSFTALRCE
jgi:hypothetical protein